MEQGWGAWSKYGDSLVCSLTALSGTGLCRGMLEWMIPLCGGPLSEIEVVGMKNNRAFHCLRGGGGISVLIANHAY